MNTIDYRHAHLLKGLVEDYIATGRPVGSERLLDVLGISVSSATIRNMLRELEEQGFVEQPHTSAGRIPTDAGYRYYLDMLTFKDATEDKVKALQDTYEDFLRTYPLRQFAAAKMLSQLARVAAASGWIHSHDIYSAGMSQIFNEEDEDEAKVAREVSRVIDTIDEHVEELTGKESNDATVYIGSENPVFDSRYTSMIVRTVRLPSGEKLLLMLIGPKRMRYKRNVSLVNTMGLLMERL